MLAAATLLAWLHSARLISPVRCRGRSISRDLRCRRRSMILSRRRSSAARLEAKAAGNATLRDRQVVTALSIAAEHIERIAIADPRFAGIIGNAATWSITGTVDLARGAAAVEQAKLVARDATIAALRLRRRVWARHQRSPAGQRY
jgi:hypothetical protein